MSNSNQLPREAYASGDDLPGRQRWVVWGELASMLVIGAMTLSLFREVARDYRCEIDEPAWITAGLVTVGLVTRAAPPAAWERAFDERELHDWGNKNPPIGKLLFGVVAAVSARPEDSLSYGWRWPHSYDWNALYGTLPPLHILRPVRYAVATMASLLLLLLYLAARSCQQPPFAAIIAPLVLFATPVFQWHAVRVYTDIPQLLFAVLGLLLFVLHVRKRSWWLLMASGLAIGVSCAVKFNSGAFVLAFAGCLVLLRKSLRQNAIAVATLLLASAAVFVAVNPYLYPDPVGRTASIMESWRNSKEQQKQDPLLAPAAVHSKDDGLARAATRGILSPGYTPPFSSLLADRIARYAPMIGALFVVLSIVLLVLGLRPRLVKSTPLVLMVAGALAAGSAMPSSLLVPGLVCAVCQVPGRLSRSQEEKTPFALLLVFMLVVLWLMTGLWLPFDWARYYLPVIIMTSMVCSIGAGEIVLSVTWDRRQPALLARSGLVRALLVGVVALLLAGIAWLGLRTLSGPLAR